FVDGGEKAARVDLLPQVGVIERNADGRLAVAIDDARHAALATHRPSGPLTGPRTRRRLDLLDGRHVQSSCSIATQTAAHAAVPPGRPPGVLPSRGCAAYSRSDGGKQESGGGRIPSRRYVPALPIAASSAATRAASASFSSRASRAISLTAS